MNSGVHYHQMGRPDFRQGIDFLTAADSQGRPALKKEGDIRAYRRRNRPQFTGRNLEARETAEPQKRCGGVAAPVGQRPKPGPPSLSGQSR